MYPAYFVILFILFILLGILEQEERKSRNNIIYGLARQFWILKERRKFVRFDKDIKVRYTLIGSKKTFIESDGHNISTRGMCISNYEKLNKRDLLELEIELDSALRPVRLMGQVIWQREIKSTDAEGRRTFNTGIKFYKIDPSAEAILMSYIYNLKQRYIE